MKTNKNKNLIVLAASFSIAGSLHSAIIADLHSDYTNTDFSGAAVGTTTFNTNNWSLYEGFPATTELTFSSTLGTDDGTGFGGTGFEEVALVSADGVFDGNSPGARELTFHPSDGSGAPSDLHIRWTADQDYTAGVTIEHSFRTPSGTNVGYALAYNSGNVVNIATNWGAAGVSDTTDAADYAALGSVSTGDTIDIIIFNADGFGGDQTFGNLVINSVPEPSSTTLLGLAGLALAIRRKR